MVYQLLDNNGLCQYYQLNERPGISRKFPDRKDKFAFLDDAKMAAGLITFRDETVTHATFYLPAIHCSSCLYLLENLPRLDKGVLSARIDFPAKEIALVFDHQHISLRQAAELLTSLGYEPYISLHDLGNARPGVDRSLLYRLGVAGFCFGNIMLFCFPEYLGLDASDVLLQRWFRYLGLFFSLPVLLYGAQPFFLSAWKGIRGRWLNIDAPIALAIAVTFIRSVWEVLSGTGSGYFDSMSGIVFFMLAGRVLQDRTYRQLSFDRDYTSWFPMSVNVLSSADGTSTAAGGGTSTTVKSLPDIREGDVLLIHSNELIPVDGILTRGQALIDYSFVTGESLPVARQVGELVYAGGRQTGASIEVLAIKEVTQSWLTQLWNRQASKPAQQTKPSFSFVHAISRWFTVIVLIIAVCAAAWWQVHDPERTWKAVTAVLIVACPCALLLSSTFTNGNILRTLARHQFYLRNAETIERIATATHIVFDKTGTLTDDHFPGIAYEGRALSEEEQFVIATLATQSTHPLSRSLARCLPRPGVLPELHQFKEWPGRGAEAIINGRRWAIGAGSLFGLDNDPSKGTHVCVGCDDEALGLYLFSGRYREGIEGLADRLSSDMHLSVLSGDTSQERDRLTALMGKKTLLHFGQSPMGKRRYIEQLQQQGEKVIMVGDGLNDAGALEQSDAGIAVTSDCSRFTPASDAILLADRLPRLPEFIRLCRAGRKIILASFGLSILYNIAGISFAVRGELSPLVAAVLMPASSLSILLLTFGSSNFLAKALLDGRRGLRRGVRKIMPPCDIDHPAALAG
jgi:Cu+-exporting ATPase